MELELEGKIAKARLLDMWGGEAEYDRQNLQVRESKNKNGDLRIEERSEEIFGWVIDMLRNLSSTF